VTFSLPAWVKLSLATSILSVLAIAPLLGVDFVRRGAVTSWTAVEVVVLGILSILWLATAADTTSVINSFWNTLHRLGPIFQGKSCTVFNRLSDELDALLQAEPDLTSTAGGVDFDDLATLCHQANAIQGLSFVNWLFLMGYVGVLLTFAIIAATRGIGRVWTSSVRDTDFFARWQPSDIPMSKQMKTNQAYAPESKEGTGPWTTPGAVTFPSELGPDGISPRNTHVAQV